MHRGTCSYSACGSFDCLSNVEVSATESFSDRVHHFDAAMAELSQLTLSKTLKVKQHLLTCEDAFLEAMANASAGYVHDTEIHYRSGHTQFALALAQISNQDDILILRRAYTSIALPCRYAIDAAFTRAENAGFRPQLKAAEDALKRGKSSYGSARHAVDVCKDITNQRFATARAKSKCSEIIAVGEDLMNKMHPGDFREAVKYAKKAYAAVNNGLLAAGRSLSSASVGVLGSVSGLEADLVREDMRAIYQRLPPTNPTNPTNLQ